MGDENHDEEKIHALIDEYWEKQNPVFDKIHELGGMQQYFDSLEDHDEAFMTQQEIDEGGACSCCSDEGNTKVENTEGRKMQLLRSPGSGILDATDLPDCDAFSRDFITSTARAAVDAGVTVFSSHKGCGAAKAVFDARIQCLRAQEKLGEARELEEKGVDAFAQEWTKAVVKEMRLYAKELKLSTSENMRDTFIEKLHRPEIHIARIIYVTDMDEFDSSYEGLPQGFVERTGGTDLSKVLRHVEVLRRIGFNDEHGFGTKFSEKPGSQFIICCVAHSRNRFDVLRAHARQQVEKLPADVQRKIRIDGFIAPARNF